MPVQGRADIKMPAQAAIRDFPVMGKIARRFAAVAVKARQPGENLACQVLLRPAG